MIIVNETVFTYERQYHHELINIPLNYMYSKNMKVMMNGYYDNRSIGTVLQHQNVHQLTLLNIDCLLWDAITMISDDRIIKNCSFNSTNGDASYDIVYISKHVKPISSYNTEVIILEIGSPYSLDYDLNNYEHLFHIYKNCFYFQSSDPLQGIYIYLLCSNSLHPLNKINWDIWNEMNITTRYYNRDIHYASFMVPEYLTKHYKTNVDWKSFLKTIQIVH